MQLSGTQHDPHARLAHKMNGHIFHVDGTMGQKSIQGTAMVHVTPEENGSGYRLMLRIRGEVDSIIGQYEPEPGYQYVLTEIVGRVTDIHRICDNTCGMLFQRDAIRIITGENVYESTSSISMPSSVTLTLEMDNAMKDCLKRRQELKNKIKQHPGNPEDIELYNYYLEQLESCKNEYNAKRAEAETRFLEGCGSGQRVEDIESLLF